MSAKAQWSALLLTSSLGVACAPPPEQPGTGNDGGQPAEEALLPLEGDLSCFTPGGPSLSQEVRNDRGFTTQVALVTKPLGGEDDEVSAEVDVSIWFNNTSAGDPDLTGTTGNDGSVTLLLPTCQPLTVKAHRAPDTEVTYKANLIVDPVVATADVTVVETLTAASIKAILNESINETSSLVAGTVYDCAGEPLVNARARVRDGSGAVIEGARDYYFNDSRLPTKPQVRSATNVDGKWVVFNLPIGEVSVEVYGKRCEGETCEEVVLGTTRLQSAGDSVNIGNVYVGVEGGVYFPAGCLGAGEEG